MFARRQTVDLRLLVYYRRTHISCTQMPRYATKTINMSLLVAARAKSLMAMLVTVLIQPSLHPPSTDSGVPGPPNEYETQLFQRSSDRSLWVKYDTLEAAGHEGCGARRSTCKGTRVDHLRNGRALRFPPYFSVSYAFCASVLPGYSVFYMLSLEHDIRSLVSKGHVGSPFPDGFDSQIGG